jgi:glycosyltransferase involved in cell wall biosynthesis
VPLGANRELLVAAALIVRDEEHCLARCLESIEPIVDEIVVVDTGSTDSTVAIAERFGATVLHRLWDDDFSAARNYGLDRIRSKWVLYIDADEWAGEVPEGFRDGLRDSGSDMALRLLLRHRLDQTPLREYRLWESHRDIRFQGVIHESIVPSIQRVCAAERRTVGLSDLLLEHDGYEGDLSAKATRDLPLLERQIESDPSRTYLWDQIGRIRECQGDIGAARKAFLQGIERIRANGAVRDTSDCLVYADLIYINAMDAAPDSELVSEALGWFPANPLVLWAATVDGFQRKAYGEVEDYATRLLAITESETAEDALGINVCIQAEWAPHLRGMARFELGDFAGAAADFHRAELTVPANPEYRVKRMLAESRCR